MRAQGFETTVTKATGDFGIDIIAIQEKRTYAVQVKRYKRSVSRRAISDAVAGRDYYRCDYAMVVTNSYFTPDAVRLAEATECQLVDRDLLAEWILKFH